MGLILILLTGLAWGGVGVVLGASSRRKIDGVVFVAVATAIGAGISWICLVNWAVVLDGDVDGRPSLLPILVTAGVAGSLGMLSLQRAMGGGAAAWTVGQSAMVIPFAVGVVCFGEPFRLRGGVGVVIIVLSMIAFSIDKTVPESGSTSKRHAWLRHALTAFLLLGLQQVLSSVPSSWDGWSDAAGIRVPVILTAGAIPLVIGVAVRGLKVERTVWRLAAAYGLIVVVGQYLLFRALDQLSLEGRISLAFPLAIGTCILLVTFWDIVVWKNRPARMTLVGLLLGVAGVVMLAM
jgi:uncharacterized membrane protein